MNVWNVGTCAPLSSTVWSCPIGRAGSTVVGNSKAATPLRRKYTRYASSSAGRCAERISRYAAIGTAPEPERSWSTPFTSGLATASISAGKVTSGALAAR
jgi:hypothetical protein